MFSTRRPSIGPDAIINLQILLESKKQSALLDSLQKMMEKTLHEDSVIQKAQLLFQYKTDKDMREDDKRMSSKLSRLLEESKLHTELLSKIDSKLVSKEDALELKRIQEEQLKLAREQSFKGGSIQPKDSPQVQLGGFGKAIALALAAGIAAFTAQIKTIGLFARAFVTAMPLAVRKAIASFAVGISMSFDLIVGKVKKAVSFIDAGLDAIKAFFSGEGKIVTFIRTAFGYARSFLTTLIEPFVALGKWVGKASALSGLFEPVMKVFSYFKTFATYVGKLAGILGKIFYPITVILTIWDTVKGAFEGFEKDGIVGALKGAIKGFFNSLIFGLADLVKSAVSWIVGALGFDGLEKMLDSFSFKDVFSTIVDFIFLPLQLLQDTIMTIVDFIKDPIQTIKNIGEKITGAFDKFKDIASMLLDAYLYIPRKLFGLLDEYVLTPFKDVFQPITDFFTKIKEQVMSFFEDFGIPEIGFTIPVINKKVSIGPFYPFRPKEGTNRVATNSSLNQTSSSTSDTSDFKQNIVTSGKTARLNKDGSVTYSTDTTDVLSESEKTIDNKTSLTNILATFDTATGKATLSGDAGEREISKRAFNKIKANAQNSGSAEAVAEIVKEDDAYQKLSWFDKRKVDFGLAKATELLPVEEKSMMVPVTPQPQQAGVVYAKSAEVSGTAQRPVSNTSVVSAPTNVVNNASTVNVPGHVRNQDSTFARYQRDSYVRV